MGDLFTSPWTLTALMSSGLVCQFARLSWATTAARLCCVARWLDEPSPNVRTSLNEPPRVPAWQLAHVFIRIGCTRLANWPVASNVKSMAGVGGGSGSFFGSLAVAEFAGRFKA